MLRVALTQEPERQEPHTVNPKSDRQEPEIRGILEAAFVPAAGIRATDIRYRYLGKKRLKG